MYYGIQSSHSIPSGIKKKNQDPIQISTASDCVPAGGVKPSAYSNSPAPHRYSAGDRQKQKS